MELGASSEPALSSLDLNSPTTAPSADELFNKASVYVFSDDRGHIKVGWTKSPEARLLVMAVGNPYPVRIAYSREMPMPLARKVERLVHSELGDRRTTKGSLKEWFTAKPEDAISAIDRFAEEVDLNDCTIGAYDRPRDPTEVAATVRLPADVADVFRQAAAKTGRPLANFLAVLLMDAVRGTERAAKELKRNLGA